MLYQEQAHDATIQCIRCLYDVELSPCDDHHAAGRKPQGLEETLALANFVLRYVDEGNDVHRKKQMLSILQMVYEVHTYVYI